MFAGLTLRLSTRRAVASLFLVISSVAAASGARADDAPASAPTSAPSTLPAPADAAVQNPSLAGKPNEPSVVTATRIDTPVSQIGNSVTIITGEEIARRQQPLV